MDDCKQRLDDLRRANSYPGAQALYKIARRAGLQVTQKQVQAFLDYLPG